VGAMGAMRAMRAMRAMGVMGILNFELGTSCKLAPAGGVYYLLSKN